MMGNDTKMGELAIHRLQNQQLLDPQMQSPEEVIGWLGAVQAQDFAGAKWAVAQRTQGATDAILEQAFNQGRILRTHVLRPTWHFVLPEDIRWMLALSVQRVKAQMASYDRQSGLDEAVFSQSNAVLEQALESGDQLTRTELASILEAAGIPATGLRLGLILLNAELDGILCSGAMRGKQFTYTLLDKRTPQSRPLSRDQALAELARRYFTSRGPATIQDFTWWSGLTTANARAGLDGAAQQLQSETIEGKTYWFAEIAESQSDNTLIAFLLPNYDEYMVGYTDRSAAYDGRHTDKLDTRGNVLFNHTMVLNGRIVGTWKRSLQKGEVLLSLAPFTHLSDAENQAFSAAAQRYEQFLGTRITFS